MGKTLITYFERDKGVIEEIQSPLLIKDYLPESEIKILTGQLTKCGDFAL